MGEDYTQQTEQTPHVEIPPADRYAPAHESLLYNADLTPWARLLWLAIHRHGSDPQNCYPSRKRLARLLGTSESTVKRAIAELADAGLLTVIERRRADGKQTSNGYQLHRSRGSRVTRTPGSPVTRQERKPEGKKTPPTPSLAEVAGSLPAGSVERGSDNDPDFGAFWNVYPRKVNKGRARKAWRSALKNCEPGRIIDAAMAFAADPNLPSNPTYIPHASSWLNGERWDDGPLPDRDEPGEQRIVGYGL